MSPRWPGEPKTEEEKRVAHNKALQKYQAGKTTVVSIRMFHSTDADILAYLSESENKAGLIKSLLRRHMMEEGWVYHEEDERSQG